MSDLGFTVSDEYDDPASVHRRQDFEGGYIAYDDAVGGYRPFPDRFMTLPFAPHADMQIVQGWYYRCDSGQCAFEDGQYHGGIDYVKVSSLDWITFDVRAVAHGKACGGNFGGETGYMVKVKHPNGYTTKYIHLVAGSIAMGIPECGTPESTWKQVYRGDTIGGAGDTGSPGVTHLHFQIENSSNTPVDPYNLQAKWEAYPSPDGTGGNTCGLHHYWTTCPPVYP